MTSSPLPLRLSDLHTQAMVGTPLTYISVTFDEDVRRVHRPSPGFSARATCRFANIALRKRDAVTESKNFSPEKLTFSKTILRRQRGLVLVF